MASAANITDTEIAIFNYFERTIKEKYSIDIASAEADKNEFMVDLYKREIAKQILKTIIDIKDVTFEMISIFLSLTNKCKPRVDITSLIG